MKLLRNQFGLGLPKFCKFFPNLPNLAKFYQTFPKSEILKFGPFEKEKMRNVTDRILRKKFLIQKKCIFGTTLRESKHS